LKGAATITYEEKGNGANKLASANQEKTSINHQILVANEGRFMMDVEW